MQGHPIAQTKKNCIDIQVKSHSAEIEVGFHTQSFTHSTLRTSFSSLFLILLLPSHTTPLFVSLINLASNNKESNNPSSIDTSYSHLDSKGSGQRADRQVRGLCHPKLVRRHPNHRDIALNHTLSRGSFVQHTTEPFPQKIDKGWIEYYVITKRQKKRWKMGKKNKEWQKVTEKKKWGKRKEKGVKLLSNIFWGTNFMWREALLLLVWTLPYQHLKCTQGMMVPSTLDALRWPWSSRLPTSKEPV